VCCRARDALRSCLPEALKDQSFGQIIRSEEFIQKWLAMLLKNLADKSTNESLTGPVLTSGNPSTLSNLQSSTGAGAQGANGSRAATNVQNSSTAWQAN
jgi:hypothetical protein